MAGFCVKDVQTVIWDGSNQEVVDDIISMIDEANKNRGHKATCRSMDEGHPTTMVIETRISGLIYGVVQKLIEKKYPGLCMFNPPLVVA